MSVICLRVPHETARLLSSIEVPGEKVAPSSMHITLLCLGEEAGEVPIEEVAKAVISTYSVTCRRKPFTVSTKKVSTFGMSEETQTVPVIARVESDDLMDFHQALKKALDEAGIPFSKKFPDFKPHVTLSYAEEKPKDFRVPEIEWAAHEATLWGGEHGDDRLSVTFPFTLKPTKQSLARNLIQTAMWQK